MDTLSNIASTATTVASKAIWGENGGVATSDNAAQSGVEPVAGVQGAGTVEEPFDKGNVEDISKELESNSHTPSVDLPLRNKIPSAGGEVTSATSRSGPSNAVDRSAVGDLMSAQQPQHEPSSTGAKDGQNKGHKDIMPHTDEEREELIKKGEFPHDPNDHSGEPMHMHTPKASTPNDGNDNIVSKSSTDRSKTVAHEGGGPHGKSGTGTQYVKTSGVQAQGGGFDATKPGAGVEANRLMDEMGVHKSGGAAAAADENQEAGSSDESRRSSDSKLSTGSQHHGKTTKGGKLAHLKEKLHRIAHKSH